ncbi:MAG TPA: hypothetical protein VIV40_40595 [Kofleriaceae bacterium]
MISALLACRSSDKPSQVHEAARPQPAAEPADAAVAAADPGHCEPQPFAASTPLPEASGAAWLTLDGKLSLVMVSDSGHNGAYAVLDPDTGDTREQGTLPLGGGGDDLEGLAARGDKLFGLTSNGLIREWRRKGTGFELVDGPYAVGSEADGLSCKTFVRCAINYEGLALASAPRGGCAGFACSKGDGRAYCLTEQEGRFAVDRTRSIAVTKPGALGDCTFDDADTLWAANNVFGADQVFRIDNWADVKTAKVVPTSAFGIGFPEVIAVRGDVVYRVSDAGGAPSLMAKFRCLAATR